MTSENSTNQYQWHPENIINGSQLTKGYVCLVINRKVTIPKQIAVNLWENAEYRCTVDGGTNRWRDFLLTHEIGNQLRLPDFITGDFDSITEETSNYFNNSSIQRIHTPDQNYTDFTKAIHFLEPLMQTKGINDIIVFHDTSGRLDHIMANIQTLFKAKSSLNVYLLGGSSMTWLLRKGQHTIHIPKELVENKRWCALLPVGGRAIVTSTGLKWNLNLSVLEFGDGIVSSSNTYSCDTVHIENTNSILWSMGVFNFRDD
ncbi:thiamin pyrophosphokinase 1 [Eupeodes corollae]|uniref:thiamin pyrophosphokinase 1 n=1 Tax=Eupeodes corollae TaxID=290404 RepID=UPI0024927B75|nr:thiamin pyrophosphokinase 1 [Eupeodes corollae]